MKRIWKIIYYVFFTAICLIAVLLIVSAFPITGNIKFLTVLSGSMEPAIKTGSIVLVKPADTYKIGDIITFGPVTKTKAPTTHRIVEMRAQEGRMIYVTKGDANKDADAREVLEKDIIGKVLFDAPYLGYAVDTAKKPYGFAVIIIIPAIIIIFDEVKKIISEIKKKKNSPSP